MWRISLAVAGVVILCAAGILVAQQEFPNVADAPVVLENDKVVVQRIEFEAGKWAGEHTHGGSQLAVVLARRGLSPARPATSSGSRPVLMITSTASVVRPFSSRSNEPSGLAIQPRTFSPDEVERTRLPTTRQRVDGTPCWSTKVLHRIEEPIFRGFLTGRLHGIGMSVDARGW
jgi:hypothetical protein